MDLEAVMDEAATVLKQITGINVFNYPPDDLRPPAGYVSYPRLITYDNTYDRGEDQFVELPFILVADKVTARSAKAKVALWSKGSGPSSVKAQMEAWHWLSCDDLTVNTCEFSVERIGDVNYLAAMFKATVVGTGSED